MEKKVKDKVFSKEEIELIDEAIELYDVESKNTLSEVLNKEEFERIIDAVEFTQKFVEESFIKSIRDQKLLKDSKVRQLKKIQEKIRNLKGGKNGN